MKKRFVSLLLALYLLFSLTQTAMAYSTVQNGSQGNDVKTLQTMLNTVDNAKLGVDGIFGAKTRLAVRNFQAANGLSVDGICGPKTWEKLTEKYNAAITPPTEAVPSTTSYPMVQTGSSGDAVSTLQTMLNTVQGSGLKVDGIFGSATKTAVIKFQSENSLSVDGICGPNTWRVLVLKYTDGLSSSITIGTGNYNPGNLVQGQTYSISGVVSSAKPLVSVTMGIYDSNGNATASIRTVYPQAKSYNIHDSDSYIRFGVLSTGTYSFQVSAVDSAGYSIELVNNIFTVAGETTSQYMSAGTLTSVQGCKQHRNASGEGICTSCATVTLLRRKQFLDGKPITFQVEDVRASLGAPFDNIMVSVGFTANGTYWRDNYTVRDGNNTVYRTVIEGSGSLKNMSIASKKQHIISLLNSHPEGIIVYCNYGNNRWHAIVISDYAVNSNGSYQFYAYDPATNSNGYSYRTELEKTWLRGRFSNTDNLISNIMNIWYIEQ